jgi:hypothetical protein
MLALAVNVGLDPILDCVRFSRSQPVPDWSSFDWAGPEGMVTFVFSTGLLFALWTWRSRPEIVRPFAPLLLSAPFATLAIGLARTHGPAVAATGLLPGLLAAAAIPGAIARTPLLRVLLPAVLVALLLLSGRTKGDEPEAAIDAGPYAGLGISAANKSLLLELSAHLSSASPRAGRMVVLGELPAAYLVSRLPPLTDTILPGGIGEHTIERYRQLGRWPDLVVVFEGAGPEPVRVALTASTAYERVLERERFSIFRPRAPRR